MEKKHLKIVLLIGILILIGGAILLFPKKLRIPKEEKILPKETWEKSKQEYKPFLKPLAEEKINEDKEKKQEKKEKEFKIIERISDLEPEKMSLQKKEEIKQELKEINREFNKKPSLEEIEGLKKKRAVIY